METVAAISTAQGVGGVGMIRISGEKAIEIAQKVFRPYFGQAENCLANLKGYSAKYGKILDGNEFIDDAVALVFKAPHSYTGEDVVEISCHGGLYITRRVLRCILDAGASLAGPGEFTKRAFLNGKMDLSQAEAVMDLISAKSKRANELAFSAKEGASSKKINEIKNQLLNIIAQLSVWADYPEDDVPEIDENTLKTELKDIYEKISKTIENYDTCKALKEGVKTAIIGRPNVGKSTLMNLLAGCNKSIVTNIPGTTRDVIEETVMVGDIPLLLVDTAGIRQTDDIIEKIGVERAKEYINISDITLMVLDASAPLSGEDIELLKAVNPQKTIVILNKCDLSKKIKAEELSTFSDKIVELSAAQGSGIEHLRKSIEDLVGLASFEPSEALVCNERQLTELKKSHAMLKKAISELELGVTLDAVTVLLQDVIEVFMEFTGERASETVVNKIFEKFCVGK